MSWLPPHDRNRSDQPCQMITLGVKMTDYSGGLHVSELLGEGNRKDSGAEEAEGISDCFSAAAVWRGRGGEKVGGVCV